MGNRCPSGNLAMALSSERREQGVIFLVQACIEVHYKNPVWSFQRGIFITLRRLSLMADNSIKITMTPSHPGDFIRTEIVEELD